MKSPDRRSFLKIAGTSLGIGVLYSAYPASLLQGEIGGMFAALGGANRAKADDFAVIEITAKRFAFAPDRITLKKGQPVRLRLHSEDVTHGFFLRPLKLDEEIPPPVKASM